MRYYHSVLLTRCAAIVATIWLVSHSVYIFDSTYRSGLRLAWQAKHGDINYSDVFSPDKMMDIYNSKRSKYLSNLLKIEGDRFWIRIESGLENALLKMFQRKDKMKGWEIKKIGSDAWANAAKQLRKLPKYLDADAPSPRVDKNITKPGDVEMNNVLVYNRIEKSGSTLLMSILYKLRLKLGFLVVRGKYHSYRYFRDNDRKGLGHFFEQASSRAKMMYIQHQYYINFTEFHIDQPRYVNMMRDPLEQFISWYFYRRTNLLEHRSPTNMSTDEMKIMSQSLEECVVERRLECVYYGYTIPRNKTKQLEFRERWHPIFFHPNDMMLHFCGHAPECSSLGNPLALQRAKYNVENYFTVVGVLEHLNESAAVFEHLLPDWFGGMKELVAEEGVKNKNVMRDKMKISEEVRQVMKSRLKDLFDLYEFVKQKLFRQYKNIKR